MAANSPIYGVGRGIGRNTGHRHAYLCTRANYIEHANPASSDYHRRGCGTQDFGRFTYEPAAKPIGYGSYFLPLCHLPAMPNDRTFSQSAEIRIPGFEGKKDRDTR